MFDQLIEAMSASAWTYLLVFAVVGGDAILPFLPGETVLITGGVLAASGDLSLTVIWVAGSLGAFAGDTTSYWVGRRFGQPAAARFLRGRRGRRTLRWADRTLRRRGGTLIVGARFVPGGRTATTLTAGTTGFRWPRFAAAAGLGAVLWSAFNTALGAIGGQAFERQPWKGLLLAFALAAGTTLVVEGVRWLVVRRRTADATER